MSYTAATGMIVAQIMALPEFTRICALHPEAGLDEATLSAIVGSAGTLAQEVIAPFNRRADAHALKTHVTCATDTTAMRVVFDAITDSVLRTHLAADVDV